jgi:hypothetical protein
MKTMDCNDQNPAAHHPGTPPLEFSLDRRKMDCSSRGHGNFPVLNLTLLDLFVHAEHTLVH